MDITRIVRVGYGYYPNPTRKKKKKWRGTTSPEIKTKWISELVIFLCNLYQLFFSFFFHFCAWMNLYTSLGNTCIYIYIYIYIFFFLRKWKIVPLSINMRSALSDTHLMILIFILFLVRATHPTQILIPKAHTTFMLQS